MHTCMCACVRTTHAHVHMHTHEKHIPDKHTPVCVHTCTHTCTHSMHMHVCTHIHMHMHAHTWTVHMHALVHAHACAHTEEGTGGDLFIYLYTHVHTHILSCSEIRAPGSHSEPLSAGSPSGGFGPGGQRGEGRRLSGVQSPGAVACSLSCACPRHLWAGRAVKNPELRRMVWAVCPGRRPPVWPGRWRVPAGVLVSSSGSRGS